MKHHMMKCGVDTNERSKAEAEEMDRDFPIVHLASYFDYEFSNSSLPFRLNGFAPDYLLYAALYNSTDGVLREPVHVLEKHSRSNNFNILLGIKFGIIRLVQSFGYPATDCNYLYQFKYVKSYVKTKFNFFKFYRLL